MISHPCKSFRPIDYISHKPVEKMIPIIHNDRTYTYSMAQCPGLFIALCTLFALPELYNFILTYTTYPCTPKRSSKVEQLKFIKDVLSIINANPHVLLLTSINNLRLSMYQDNEKCEVFRKFTQLMDIIHEATSCNATVEDKKGFADMLDEWEKKDYKIWQDKIYSSFSLHFLLFEILMFVPVSGKLDHYSIGTRSYLNIDGSPTNSISVDELIREKYVRVITDPNDQKKGVFLRLPKYLLIRVNENGGDGREYNVEDIFNKKLDMRDLLYVKYRMDNEKFVYGAVAICTDKKIYFLVADTIYSFSEFDEYKFELVSAISTRKTIKFADIRYIVYARSHL